MLPFPLKNPDKRFDAGKWLMIIGMSLLSMVIFLRLLMHPTSDISIHTVWAGECTFADLSSFVHHGAHPLWHLLVHLVVLMGVELTLASALVTTLCKAVELWLLHRILTVMLYDRLSRAAITGYTAACATVSCLLIPFYNNTVYLGVGSPNTWHSCTQLIAMCWMLLCVPYVAWCWDSFSRRLLRDGQDTLLPWKYPILLGVMLLMSLLAKPTFMQAFLPACCLYFLWQWIRHPKNSRFFVQIIVCVLPAVLFMIFQYLYYFGIIVPWQANMVLEVGGSKFWNVLVRVVLIMAFPIYSIIACRKQKADTLYVLTVLFNAVAIVEFLILGENGRRASDGNFGWGMMGASLMLWVVCLGRFLKEAKLRKPEKRHVPGWILLGWHLFSGIYYILYLLYTGAAL